MSSDITSLSHENQESGLWLWQGKAPPLPSPSQPASRVRRCLDPIVSALRRGGWIALPGGVVLTLLAVVLRSTPLDKPAPVDTPAVAIAPVPSPADAHPDFAAPPVNIPAPAVEHADIQLDQAQIPSAPASLLPARGTEHQLSKKKTAPRPSARTVRRTHTSADTGSPFVIHGVLTPPR